MNDAGQNGIGCGGRAESAKKKQIRRDEADPCETLVTDAIAETAQGAGNLARG